MSDKIKIPCIKIEQPIGIFYIGVIGFENLRSISYSDIRQLDRELDNYLGIQRKISPKRVDELQRYVNNVDATFPTSVILSISSEDATYDPKSGCLIIENKEEVAKIIDGQHRIKGLELFKGEKFDINVTIFIDMDIEDQAMVFATINLAQTKVNKSLVYDLYEYSKNRSPQKTAHNIARLLNLKEESPFYQRIKILGTADLELKTTQIITQATFVEAMIKYISGSVKQALSDRDLLKRGQSLPKLPNGDIFFREMFVNKDDAKIMSIIWNYFSAVSKRWPNSWNSIGVIGNILPRTNGFRALMRNLPYVLNYLQKNGLKTSENDFLNYFKKIDIDDGDFTSDIYKPGSSGEKDLLENLRIK